MDSSSRRRRRRGRVGRRPLPDHGLNHWRSTRRTEREVLPTETEESRASSRCRRRPAAPTLTARSWQTEAPLRMLQNNLDPEVAERPDDLVVYGGTGKAARDWPAYDAIVRTLTTLARRRDAARAVRPAGRRHAHPRVGAARADRQLQPGPRLGDLAGVPPARAARA